MQRRNSKVNAPDMRAQRNSRILVAEDEPELLRFYKVLLEDMGHEIVTATNGLECLDKFLADARYDLVILDHKMPKMTGMEVAIEIAAAAPLQQLLMITAYAGVLDLTLKPENMMIMAKPFELDQLKETIRGILFSVRIRKAMTEDKSSSS